MKDDTREQLSAYLDNALPEAERRDLEALLAASAELRGALEDLRAVSRAVKELPQEPLPPGFIARFHARRARGDKPRENWVFLPPQARPVVAALSIGVVALVIWDKVAVPPEDAFLHPSDAAKVYESANAPVAQFDLMSRITGASGETPPSGAGLSSTQSLGIDGVAAKAGRQGDKLSAPFDKNVEQVAAKPLRSAERDYHKAALMRMLENGQLIAHDATAPESMPAGGAAPFDKNVEQAAGQTPAKANGGSARAGMRASGTARGYAVRQLNNRDEADAELQLTDRTKLAMTEEERSARNEQMFSQLEKQKKQMGMKVLAKSEAGVDANRVGFLGLREPPAAPAIRPGAPTMLKSVSRADGGAASAAISGTVQATGPGRLASEAALVFTDAGSVATSWVLLGLPGDPPAIDFSSGRLVIIKPSATKILSVAPGPDAVTVVYRSLLPNEEPDPARDRVAALPSAPKTVLIYDASPR